MKKDIRVLVFGASGKTGRIIVKKLLKEGYQVRAFVRNLRKVNHISHPDFTVSQGDVRSTKAVEDAVKDSDIVLSALGNLRIFSNTIISDGVANIISAMKLHEKKRLLFMSSLGVGDSKGQLGLIHNLIYLPTFLWNVFRDKERQEKLIHESGLAWTIIRPAGFILFPLPLHYRKCVMPLRPRVLPIMSRYHTADFIIKECSNNQYIQKNVALSYF
ncbi:MAG TPA: NAD(P)H-binding protein [Chitinophagaceae bacterium]